MYTCKRKIYLLYMYPTCITFNIYINLVYKYTHTGGVHVMYVYPPFSFFLCVKYYPPVFKLQRK